MSVCLSVRRSVPVSACSLCIVCLPGLAGLHACMCKHARLAVCRHVGMQVSTYVYRYTYVCMYVCTYSLMHISASMRDLAASGFHWPLALSDEKPRDSKHSSSTFFHSRRTQTSHMNRLGSFGLRSPWKNSEGNQVVVAQTQRCNSLES